MRCAKLDASGRDVTFEIVASSLVTCAASVLVAIHGELCYVFWEKVRSVPDQAQRMPVMADRRRGV